METTKIMQKSEKNQFVSPRALDLFSILMVLEGDWLGNTKCHAVILSTDAYLGFQHAGSGKD